MRYINKRNKEPKELIEYRRTPGVAYDDLGGDRKSIIRDSLLDEQGYICAYCMGKIDNESCTIEHYISQSRHPDSPYSEGEHRQQSLLYSNMLGVCINNAEHCDKKRGNIPLEILNPHDPSCEELITYEFDGRIVPAGREINKVEKDINTLGLGSDKLAKLRKTVWDEVWERFNKEHEKKEWTKELFLEYASMYRTKQRRRHNISKFHAYCNFIAWAFEYYADNYQNK